MTQSADHQGLRIVFAGTPDFAAQQLQTLLDSQHQLVAVYTQPDRPSGRGKKLSASPVKQLAEAHQIPVYQPSSLKNSEAQAEFDALNADIMVVVAYGLLLPQTVLDLPRLGCINVHASLLPRWRGAAPIQRALEAGDQQTGITIMQMDAGLDTGAMLVKRICPILPDDTAGNLQERLANSAGPALLKALAQLERGEARPEPQNDSQSCYAAKITKAEAFLDWPLPADQLARKVRAFNPYPITFTQLTQTGVTVRVWAAEVRGRRSSETPGCI